jgi:hypothetical protein
MAGQRGGIPEDMQEETEMNMGRKGVRLDRG